MAGAPSQLDLFDYKPTLAKYNGKPVPAEVVKGQKYAFIKPDAALFATEFKFAKHGQCGAEISEALPHLAEVVDDIAIVKSMTTDAFNHAPGQILMQTGSTQFGRPSMGSWVMYGLGSEAQNLPGFVVLNSAGGTERRRCALGQRIFADRLPGRAVPQKRRSGSVSVQSRRASPTRCSANASTCIKELNQKHLGSGRRSGNRHAHQFLRNGVSHAIERAGIDGYFERIARDA